MGEEPDDPALQLSAMTASTIGLHEQVLEDLVKDSLADAELRDEYLLPDDLRKQDGLLYNHLGKLVVPDRKLRLVLMHDYHDAVISGHLGLDKSLSNLQKTFTWPGVRRQFTSCINSCDQCQPNKSSSRAPAGLLQPLEVPKEPWEHVSLDFIMALPPSDGFEAILVVVDKLSKPMVLVPTVTTGTAKETARLYFDKSIVVTGWPARAFRTGMCVLPVPSGRNCTSCYKYGSPCPRPSTLRPTDRPNERTAA
jgi:Integrase zinc binding domain